MKSKDELKVQSNYHAFHHEVLLPALNECLSCIENDQLMLHQAYAFNMLIAHTVDHIWQVAKVFRSQSITRKSIIDSLDTHYGLESARFPEGVFKLIDGVNNSIKHVELDSTRSNNQSLINCYGQFNFLMLKGRDGRVYFSSRHTDYFDYGRIVLRHAAELLNVRFDEIGDDILDLLDGQWTNGYEDEYTDDPIDMMIEYCNPICQDCGRGESCDCDNYSYVGQKGFFNPETNDHFNFDDVMSSISGAYKP